MGSIIRLTWEDLLSEFFELQEMRAGPCGWLSEEWPGGRETDIATWRRLLVCRRATGKPGGGGPPGQEGSQEARGGMEAAERREGNETKK